MSYKDKYIKLSNAYGTINARDIHINNTKAVINQLFLNNPSAKRVRFNDSTEEKWVWIVEDTKNSTSKRIIMPPDESLKPGWIVYWNDEIWLCMQADKSNKEIYESGYIEKCNAELKWVDDEGIIQSFPCVFYFNTRSNFGVEEDRIMTLPDGRRQVAVQLNEHTIKIKRDQRFLFNGQPFKVIDYDSISDEGIFNISLESTQLSSDDNLELGIANYYSKLGNYTITILNGNPLSIQNGTTIQLQAEVKNNGQIVSMPIIWSVSDPSLAEVDESGILLAKNKGSVIVTASIDNVTDSIEVNIIESATNNYVVNIIGSDSINFNMSKEYRAIFTNNGLPIEESSYFYLTAEDGVSPTTLASITSQDSINNTCVIKAGNKIGKVVLHVVNKNGLIKNSKLIQIKSLI